MKLSNMSWNYNNIELFIDLSDIARKAIIDKCRDEGYDIPSDKERIEKGLAPIRISEIPDYLIEK